MKRWPLVRHVRWLVLTIAVRRHYNHWRQLGYLPVNAQSDYEVLDRIWRGDA